MSKEQVVDSTKGHAIVSPREYKREVPMQVWLQSRHLATLLRWIEQEEFTGLVRFRSDILKIVVEQLVIHLVESGTVKMVEMAQEAHAILEGRFGVPCNPGETHDKKGKGYRNTMHNFVLDGKKTDPNPATYRVQQPAPVQTTPDKPAFDMDEATRIYRALERKESLELAKKDIADVLANADVHIDKDGRKIITPRGVPKGIATQEVWDKSQTEQAERDTEYKEEEKEKKKQYKLKVKRDKLLAQLDELDEVVEEKEEDSAPAERSYDEILADRVAKDKIQDSKLSMENDPMLDNKTKET